MPPMYMFSVHTLLDNLFRYGKLEGQDVTAFSKDKATYKTLDNNITKHNLITIKATASNLVHNIYTTNT